MRSIATQTTITTTATTNTNTNTGNVFLRRLRCSSSDAHQSDKKTRRAARRNGPETTTTGASSEEEEEQQQQRRHGDDFADDDDANVKTKMMTSRRRREILTVLGALPASVEALKTFTFPVSAQALTPNQTITISKTSEKMASSGYSFVNPSIDSMVFKTSSCTYMRCEFISIKKNAGDRGPARRAQPKFRIITSS